MSDAVDHVMIPPGRNFAEDSVLNTYCADHEGCDASIVADRSAKVLWAAQGTLFAMGFETGMVVIVTS